MTDPEAVRSLEWWLLNVIQPIGRLFIRIIFMIVIPTITSGFNAIPPQGVNLKSQPEEDEDQVLGIDAPLPQGDEGLAVAQHAEGTQVGVAAPLADGGGLHAQFLAERFEDLQQLLAPLLRGTVVTVQLALVSTVFGAILAFAAGIGKLSTNPFVRALAPMSTTAPSTFASSATIGSSAAADRRRTRAGPRSSSGRGCRPGPRG